MKRQRGIRPQTVQKYFNYLTYIYSKTQKPIILKVYNLSTKFNITPAAFTALKDLGILEFKKDQYDSRYTRYKWVAEKPSRKMAIEIIKNSRPKKQKEKLLINKTDFSKGIVDNRIGIQKENFDDEIIANKYVTSKLHNSYNKTEPEPVKKEEKTAVNISIFWGLFKITLKK